ncbi:hypothetical protein [Gimesia panareensis]|uniref:hypothetical protein n=1 Tax=Gimesia panareensis TaxID=2527978 RepID=UPI001189A0FA|nr:hypothetical protein [Gimesia panareensis]QDU52985.1 hypothetical protein Pan110_53670 [Gimesia panareensis]
MSSKLNDTLDTVCDNQDEKKRDNRREALLAGLAFAAVTLVPEKASAYQIGVSDLQKFLGDPTKPEDYGAFGKKVGGLLGIDLDNASSLDIGKIVGDVVKKLFTSNQEFLKELVNALQLAIGEVLKALESTVGEFPPKQVKKPAELSFGLINELGKLLEKIPTEPSRPGIENRKDQIEERIIEAGNSIQKLIEIIAPGGFFLSSLFGQNLTDALKDALNGKQPDEIISKLFKDIIGDVFDDLFSGSLLSFDLFKLPQNLGPNQLHMWLNKSTYVGGDNNWSERRLRVRFITEIDEYIRRQVSEIDRNRSLSDFCEKESTFVLTDLLSIFFNVFISHALEPAGVPSLTEDVDVFEDYGDDFAVFSGRQVQGIIKASLGSAMRGVWLWKVDNINLIEGGATLVGSIFSSIVEGVVRNLAWTVKITSIYPDQAPTGIPIIEPWKIMERVWSKDEKDVEYLKMIAFIRHPVTGIDAEPFKNLNQLEGLLKDWGAYIDARQQRLRFDPQYRPVVSDDLTIERLDAIDSKIIVEACSDESTTSPLPILRMLILGHSLVMKPIVNSATKKVKYVAEYDITYMPKRLRIIIVSNRGGRVERVIQTQL